MDSSASGMVVFVQDLRTEEGLRDEFQEKYASGIAAHLSEVFGEKEALLLVAEVTSLLEDLHVANGLAKPAGGKRHTAINRMAAAKSFLTCLKRCDLLHYVPNAAGQCGLFAELLELIGDFHSHRVARQAINDARKRMNMSRPYQRSL